MNENDLEAGPSRSEAPETSAPEVTALLQAWTAGDEGARDRLIPLVYRELHRLAHHYMAGEQPEATLQTTALVNELYVRLVDVRRIGWTGRTHFFAVCAQLMRRALVDMARTRKAAKRGGHALHVPLDERLIASPEPPVDILALDDALDRLGPSTPGRVAWWSFVSLAALMSRKPPPPSTCPRRPCNAIGGSRRSGCSGN